MNTKEKIAYNIKTLRQEKGLTQQQLANSTGLSYRSIINYENAYRLPKVETIELLARYFEVSCAYLRGETDNRDYVNYSNNADNEQDVIILNMVMHKLNKMIEEYSAKLLKADFSQQQDANFMLQGWINLIVRVVFNDDQKSSYNFMKIANELDKLNTEGFRELSKRISELSRLDEYTENQK